MPSLRIEENGLVNSSLVSPPSRAIIMSGRTPAAPPPASAAPPPLQKPASRLFSPVGTSNTSSTSTSSGQKRLPAPPSSRQITTTTTATTTATKAQTKRAGAPLKQRAQSMVVSPAVPAPAASSGRRPVARTNSSDGIVQKKKSTPANSNTNNGTPIRNGKATATASATTTLVPKKNPTQNGVKKTGAAAAASPPPPPKSAPAFQNAQSTITTDRKPAARSAAAAVVARPRKPSSESSDLGAEAKHQARAAAKAPAVKNKAPPTRGETAAPTVAKMPPQLQQRPGAERNTDDGAASKNQARAAANAPATRLHVHASASIPDPQKEKEIAAAQAGRGGSSSNGNTSQNQEPGAYSVQGPNMARAISGVLSPQGGAAAAAGQASGGKNSEEEDGKWSPPVRATATAVVTHAPTQEPRAIAVAAELSSDVEAQIVEQIRRQLLQEAARADVVAVEHSTTRSVNADEQARRVATMKELHKPKGVREKLFGDARSVDSAVDISASPECIRKRDYLKWTVKRNRTTNMWVASVNTNQKALECNDTIELERAMRSYTATTQQEAFETGLAMAIPRMLPFDENPICYVCKAKFALLRRPCHCRNCGVCICSSCSTNWPARMVPDTYNTKNESQVTVCMACDWLSGAFRDALADGRFKAIVNLYATGNINVRNPFCNVKKEEIFYPIHLAVLGGNFKVVQWICSERFCPLRSTRKKGKSKEGPILTSKGRSPLALALTDQKLDIVRYLVADKNMSFFEEKGLTTATALANFTSMLRMVPRDIFEGKKMEKTQVPTNPSFLGSSSFSLTSLSD